MFLIAPAYPQNLVRILALFIFYKLPPRSTAPKTNIFVFIFVFLISTAYPQKWVRNFALLTFSENPIHHPATPEKNICSVFVYVYVLIAPAYHPTIGENFAMLIVV